MDQGECLIAYFRPKKAPASRYTSLYVHRAAGYDTPTPVQKYSIPAVLEGWGRFCQGFVGFARRFEGMRWVHAISKMLFIMNLLHLASISRLPV